MIRPTPVMRSPIRKLGRGLKVRFTLVDGSIEAEWLSRLPTPRDRRALPRYRAARDAFLREVGATTMRNVAVLELP